MQQKYWTLNCQVHQLEVNAKFISSRVWWKLKMIAASLKSNIFHFAVVLNVYGQYADV